MLRLGVHISIAGKIYKSFERAQKLGCNTMQIFARNPRQWRKKYLSSEDIAIFKTKKKESKIKPVIIHIPYILNLASHKESFHKVTIREFTKDLIEADKLEADYLVTHLGSYKNGAQKPGLLKIIKALNLILEENKGVKTQILLENTSGGGSWLGYELSHFKFLFERINLANRLGICLDTAHLWAAGYKINEKKGLSKLILEIEKEAGMDKIKLIHLNDTQVELGSRLDRHFHIGKGCIGEGGFRLILNQAGFKNLPFILETPKKNVADDRKNLKMARRLASEAIQKRN